MPRGGEASRSGYTSHGLILYLVTHLVPGAVVRNLGAVGRGMPRTDRTYYRVRQSEDHNITFESELEKSLDRVGLRVLHLYMRVWRLVLQISPLLLFPLAHKSDSTTLRYIPISPKASYQEQLSGCRPHGKIQRSAQPSPHPPQVRGGTAYSWGHINADGQGQSSLLTSPPHVDPAANRIGASIDSVTENSGCRQLLLSTPSPFEGNTREPSSSR
ncbi:hypothetical protein F4677DRAFT_258113 [Hypoxylon crocopeplum]|nr:hypothetical protein F4677DRAFT_258113 [Hypoxylon crocopeplum]